jgi:hypothetical protein
MCLRDRDVLCGRNMGAFGHGFYDPTPHPPYPPYPPTPPYQPINVIRIMWLAGLVGKVFNNDDLR